MISEDKMTRHTEKKGQVRIPCAKCSTIFCPSVTKTHICPTCIMATNDISDGITKSAIVNYCRDCARYLAPPWIYCELESKELLSICLKKLKGLSKVKLLDAVFKWTEPHSKRLRVELTIQKEVGNNIALKQTFEVEFVVHWMQCEDCQREFTPHTWKAQVQVRQRAAHKKTFLWLEQLILKKKIHQKAIKITQEPDGLNFFFRKRNEALMLMNFLKANVPSRMKESKELISHDIHTSSYNYKYSYFFEMPKICKDDLILMPKALCRELGGVNALAVCYRVKNRMCCYDPVTLQVFTISSDQYFRYEQEMEVINFRGNGTEYMVVDVERDAAKATTFQETTFNKTFNDLQIKFACLEVQKMSGDGSVHSIDCHFGSIMNHGDMCVGYDVKGLSIIEDLELLPHQKRIPEVILVRKIYPKNLMKKRKFWKLKRMEVEKNEGFTIRKTKKKNLGMATEEDKDMEELREELEQDKRMRKEVNIYLDKKGLKELKHAKPEEPSEGMDEDDLVADPEMIQLTELIQNFDLNESSNQEDEDAKMAEMMRDMEVLNKLNQK